MRVLAFHLPMGIVRGGVPVDSEFFLRDHMRGTPATIGTPTVARHIVTMKDK